MRTYTKNFLRHKYLKKLAKQVTSSSLQWKIKKLLGVSNVIHTFRLGILIKKKELQLSLSVVRTVKSICL